MEKGFLLAFSYRAVRNLFIVKVAIIPKHGIPMEERFEIEII